MRKQSDMMTIRQYVKEFWGSSDLNVWLNPMAKRPKERTLLMTGDLEHDDITNFTEASYALAGVAQFLAEKTSHITLSYFVALHHDNWKASGTDVLVSLTAQLMTQIEQKRPVIDLSFLGLEGNSLERTKSNMRALMGIIHQALDLLSKDVLVYVIMDLNSCERSHGIIRAIMKLASRRSGATVKILIGDYDIRTQHKLVTEFAHETYLSENSWRVEDGRYENIDLEGEVYRKWDMIMQEIGIKMEEMDDTHKNVCLRVKYLRTP